MTEMSFKRYFTPREANDTLRTVRIYLEAMADLVYRARQINERRKSADGLQTEAATEQLDGLREQIQILLARIQSEGVELKGMDPPLLDFPALRNGQEVYLCWRAGEPQVGWWHPLHTGIQGRQDLLLDDPGWWEWCN